MTTKLINGVRIDITGTQEETDLLAEWADNEPGTGAKWLADQAAIAARYAERTDLRDNATAAIDMLDQYLLIADAATAAQVREQAKRLSQMVRRLIVRLVQLD